MAKTGSGESTQPDAELLLQVLILPGHNLTDVIWTSFLNQSRAVVSAPGSQSVLPRRLIGVETEYTHCLPDSPDCKPRGGAVYLALGGGREAD